MKYYRQKILVITVLTLCIAFIFSSTMISAHRQLIDLGHSEYKARNLISLNNVFNIVELSEKEINEALEVQLERARAVGLDNDTLMNAKITSHSLVHKLEVITLVNDEREMYLNEKIQAFSEIIEDVSFDEELTLYENYNKLSNKVDAQKESMIQDYIRELNRLSYFNYEVVEDKAQTLANVQGALTRVQERMASLNGFQNASLQQQAKRLFNLINNYRANLGLRPFTYNHAMQSCVFLEAQTYAATKNPHPWVCQPVSNANASLASVHSDYVQIAMNFFMSSPSHEAVISGNYSSATIAFWQVGNMVYMILYTFR